MFKLRIMSVFLNLMPVRRLCLQSQVGIKPKLLQAQFYSTCFASYTSLTTSKLQKTIHQLNASCRSGKTNEGDIVRY